MSGTLVVLGTRPDAIKLAPVVHGLRGRDGAEPVRVCATAQHREMLDPVLELFEIVPDSDLDAMPRTSGLADLTATLLRELTAILEVARPSRLVVQGDTTTAATAALAAFYMRVPVAHVEAGLRTGDLSAPWPEELNRRLISMVSDLHFAPTEEARGNLLAEGVAPDRVVLTGNTVIDALLHVTDRFASDAALEADHAARFPFLRDERRLILVTGHRRESFDEGLANICGALRDLASNRDEVEIVYPVHLNPVVREIVDESLGERRDDAIHLVDPVGYPDFIYLMRRAHLILTDSGGIQEEAPALGKPVLVMREKTERPEVIEHGAARLVGTSRQGIVANAQDLLDDEGAYTEMAQVRWIYGDGRAAERIADRIAPPSR